MPTPMPHQIEGAKFLASNKAALLADEQRVGKTGAAIMAADFILAQSVLVVTTASGRPVWRRGFAEWSVLDREVRIVGWPELTNPKTRAELLGRRWDVLILDEEHAAKNYEAKRTQAVYGLPVNGGRELSVVTALVSKADVVWPLTGTPLPHSPADGYPRLRALAPERLREDPTRGWPDVTQYDDFLHRYCVVRMKKISQFNRIPVVIGGKNLEELRERMKGFVLRRTQADVGILPPRYDLLPLTVSERDKREAFKDADQAAVLAAAEKGETKDLEMHLGPLRRLTGMIKANAVAEAVEDEFDGGLDKIVLMYWHRDVGDSLQLYLRKYGVTRLDGSTTDRAGAVAAFNRPDCRVFLGQIVAAGEAIDLSAAAVLWFVETSFSPKDMSQAAARITNHTQTRSALVKVCTLEGSIDEALQASLMRLWTAIRGVLGK